MDPEANLSEQLELAREILAENERITDDGGNTPDEFWHDGTVESLLQRAERLAELVQALAEWRRKGGFDPLTNAPLDHIRALVEYDWASEQRNFEEEDDGEGPTYAKDGTRVWHAFERLQVIDKWLSEVTQGSAKAKVVTLVIRDPDYENEHVEEVTGEVDIETIDIDLGDEFNGPKDFDAESDWGQEWIASVRERVAHLPGDGPIRQRIDQLINDLT